jgi:hypothetical protein
MTSLNECAREQKEINLLLCKELTEIKDSINNLDTSTSLIEHVSRQYDRKVYEWHP